MALSGKLNCLDLVPCGFQMGWALPLLKLSTLGQSAFIECLLNVKLPTGRRGGGTLGRKRLSNTFRISRKGVFSEDGAARPPASPAFLSPFAQPHLPCLAPAA